MDPLEVPIGKYQLAAFDGRVLEVFTGAKSSSRSHVKHQSVTVTGPDKKGSRTVVLSGDLRVSLDEDDLAAFQPLLDALQQVGVKVVAES